MDATLIIAIVVLGICVTLPLYFLRLQLRLRAEGPDAASEGVPLPEAYRLAIPFTFRGRRYQILLERKPRERRPPSLGKYLWFVALLAIVLFCIIRTSFSHGVHRLEPIPVLCLRNYSTAQVSFQIMEAAKMPGNTSRLDGYCDNFRNLYYGKVPPNADLSPRNPRTSSLAMISHGHADAFAAPTAGAPTLGDHAAEAIIYHGYLFFEDPHIVATDGWETNYGLVAYPALPGKEEQYIYWIDRENTVHRLRTRLPDGAPLVLLSPDQSPLSPLCTLEWEIV